MTINQVHVGQIVRTTVTTRSSFSRSDQWVIEEGAEGRVVETSYHGVFVEFEAEDGRCVRVQYDRGEVVPIETGTSAHEITLLALTECAVRRLIDSAVAFELSGGNIDRPDAGKYGTHPDGSPRYAPEWYTVQGVKTGIVEGLHGALRSVLTCPSTDEHGHHCTGSVGHETCHWDGNGCNWDSDTSGYEQAGS